MAFTSFTITYESNKSFLITATDGFDSTKKYTTKIERYNSDGITLSGETFPCSLVTDSSNPTDNTKKMLIIGKIDYFSMDGHNKEEQDLIDMVVPSGYKYKISISENSGTPISANTTTITAHDPIVASDIAATTFGNNILQIKSTKPLRNVFTIVPIDINGNVVPPSSSSINKYVLSNFYIKYNGTFIPIPFDVGSNSFFASLSEDGKILTLEDKTFRFPNAATGYEHTLFVNYRRYQPNVSDISKVLTDYTDTKRIIATDTINNKFTVTALSTNTVPTSADGLSRTEIKVTFNNEVLLPSSSDIENYNNILYSNELIGGIVQGPLKIDKVQRIGQDYKTLFFQLNRSTALPSSTTNPYNASIDIGSSASNQNGALLDSSGNLILKTNKTVSVAVPTPTVTSVVQDTAPSCVNCTVLSVVFSTEMLDSPTGEGANNPANYELSSVDFTPAKKPTRAMFVQGTSNTTVELTFEGILITGNNLATLKTANIIKSSIGDLIASNTVLKADIKIVDTTKPSVLQIIALNRANDNRGKTISDKDNALIIKFKTPMSITPSENAANTPTNYKFIETINNVITPPTGDPLPTGTTVTPSENNSWFRFVLPVNSNYPVFEKVDVLRPNGVSSGQPNENYNIFIGYTGLTPSEYRYVANTNGNVYSICDYKKIDATVPLINLSVGEVKINSDSKLIYKYTDGSTVNNIFYHNEFNPTDIIKQNFKILVSDTLEPVENYHELTILNATLVPDDNNNTSIEFEFASETFDSGTKYVYIATNNTNTDIKVKDIFGKEVIGVFIGKAANNVPSKIVSLSLTKLDKTTQVLKTNDKEIAIGYPLEVAVKFSNVIKNTSANDFLISFNNTGTGITDGTNIPILSADVLTINGENTNTVILKGYISALAADRIDSNSIYVRTITQDYLIMTKDINNNTIKPLKAYAPVSNFYVKNAVWHFDTPGDLNNATLTVEFNSDLDLTTIPLEALAPSGITLSDINFISNTQHPTDMYLNLSSTNPGLGLINLVKYNATKGIFTSALDNTKFNINIQCISSTKLLFRFSKLSSAYDLTLNTSNLLYIQYTGQPYVLKGYALNPTTGAPDHSVVVYANTSFDYNANTPIK